MTTTTDLDEDVLEEKQRIQSLMKQPQQKSDVLLVNDLFKQFGNFTAVSGLNFGVKPGECFGLLGVNGAGKTTSFRMYVPNSLYINVSQFVTMAKFTWSTYG